VWVAECSDGGTEVGGCCVVFFDGLFARKHHEAIYWNFYCRRKWRIKIVVRAQEVVATIMCQCGKFLCGCVASCLRNNVSTSRNFRVDVRRFFSWSSSLTFVGSAIFTSGITWTVNIGSSSGVYTNGVLRLARVVPCNSGRVRTSPAVLKHMVVF
jgi:hypothetical protein